MENLLYEESILCFLEYGSVILTNEFGEKKVLHSEDEIDFAFELSENGLTPMWVSAE